jgi:hypothetical protein
MEGVKQDFHTNPLPCDSLKEVTRSYREVTVFVSIVRSQVKVLSRRLAAIQRNG